MAVAQGIDRRRVRALTERSAVASSRSVLVRPRPPEPMA